MPRSSPRRPGAHVSASLLATALGALSLALGAYGDTIQDRPLPHNTLEGLIVAPYPVYWLGRSFQGLPITGATHDPGGAFTVQYGDCVVGGQNTCVPALKIVTSPDNSFLAGGDTPQHETLVRGVRAVVAREGEVIEVPTAGVVVGIYADRARLAAAAAEATVPINEASEPGAPLPAQRPDTGFGATPLPSQVPSPLSALR